MKNNQPTSRRDFLKSAVVLPAAVAALPATAIAASSPKDVSKALPMRKLGRNGPEVTMLNIGGMMSAHNPQYLDLAWDMGIRYFDTADCYKNGKSEQDVGAWVNRYPERRKDIFIVTKDHPKKGPEELLTMIDRRLENLGIDYVDMFFIHGIGTKSYGKDSLDWPKSDRMKDVFDELKASGKVKYCGFSCHDKKLIQYLNAAAEGGFIDAIMLRYNPLMKSGDDLDRALDACHEAGIGLVAMKEMQAFKKAPVSHPSLEETGLSTHQVVLQAVWSDPRIASVCSNIENIQQMEFIPEYTIFVQHWGIMVCLIGVFMVAAAFKKPWRTPILLYGLLEKAFMVFLVASNAGEPFAAGFYAPAGMDAFITVWSIAYFMSRKDV